MTELSDLIGLLDDAAPKELQDLLTKKFTLPENLTDDEMRVCRELQRAITAHTDAAIVLLIRMLWHAAKGGYIENEKVRKQIKVWERDSRP